MRHTPFDGWGADAVSAALRDASLSRDWYVCRFADGISDVLRCFLDGVNAQMAARIASAPTPARLSERVAEAVMTRLDILLPHREAVRRALAW
ncbi:MAG: hypothetical protein J0L97_09500, partial [Alphaproteobacteria bacterium]|nr:hypothetical protein [Alphaproteobacteria bacterium]